MFNGPLIVEILEDGLHVKVVLDFTFTDATGRVWIAPQGLISDGASIPRLFWTAVGSPFTGQYRRAAILHDSAYSTPGMDKSAADKMLLEASLADGCDEALANIIYEGVKVGGARSFYKDQEVVGAANA